MAGYTNEMGEMLDINPGLRERIQFYIDFPDYTAEELTSIFINLCKEEKYRVNEKTKTKIKKYFSKIISTNDKNFANGRIARKIFERIRLKQALRTTSNFITEVDVDSAFLDKDLLQLCDNKKSKKIIGFSNLYNV